ncbi:hypothetical protein BS78_K087700 [Paspalum vaginatum]|uniref:Uncharacterized protein n=1 Tax=Paspalum vaginatum TaxID=158149 RepID=A0A9W7XCL2_9POAL|nr:hypothetical protein BS78_K087700 [Paspalum vaginatum]
MKQQRCRCSLLSHKLLAILMSVAVLAVMIIGILTGASESMGGRGHGQPPPAPVSPDHGMQTLSPDKS